MKYVATVLLGFSLLAVQAEHDMPDPLPEIPWSFDGWNGTFKRDQLQRGFQVYKEVCSSCHGIKLLRFRELEAIGFTEAQVKALAASYDVDDGPNLEGDMFVRKGLPSDVIPGPYKNDNQAKSVNNGAVPPDLSLIVKARKGQGRYRRNLELIESACRVTGVTDKRLLRASHIKPWRLCNNNHERLDGNNGFLLTPNIDLLFDQGYISFDDDGRLLVSTKIAKDQLAALNLPVEDKFMVGMFNDEQRMYLEFHRLELFRS